MGDDDPCDGKARYEIRNIALRVLVQIRGALIKKQNVRVSIKRSRKKNALTLSA